jgi:hypothetical protein
MLLRVLLSFVTPQSLCDWGGQRVVVCKGCLCVLSVEGLGLQVVCQQQGHCPPERALAVVDRVLCLTILHRYMGAWR